MKVSIPNFLIVALYFLQESNGDGTNVPILRNATETPLTSDKLPALEPNLAPVIDLTGPTTELDSVPTRKDCGPDNLCVPDLQLRVSQSNASFVIGSNELIWVEVDVYNNGGDSFGSALFIQVPHGLSYIHAESLGRREDVIADCGPPSPSSNNTVICQIGNPLPAFAKAIVRVYFDTRYRKTEVQSSYEFFISVNSTNPGEENRRGNNFARISIPIIVKTELKIFGVSTPQSVTYNASYYRGLTKVNESQIGPEVRHTYEIKCMGPSSIEEATVVILWPSFTAEGDHFLYLLEEPKIDGPATCEPISTVNPLGIQIQRKREYWVTATTISDLHSSPDSSSGFDSIQQGSGGVFETQETSGSVNRNIFTPVSFQNGSEKNYLDRQKPSSGEDVVPCGIAKCTRIRCRIGPMSRDSSVIFYLRGRIYADTLEKRFLGGSVELSSKLRTEVTQLPYNLSSGVIQPKELFLRTLVQEEIDPLPPPARLIKTWHEMNPRVAPPLFG